MTTTRVWMTVVLLVVYIINLGVTQTVMVEDDEENLEFLHPSFVGDPPPLHGLPPLVPNDNTQTTSRGRTSESNVSSADDKSKTQTETGDTQQNNYRSDTGLGNSTGENTSSDVLTVDLVQDTHGPGHSGSTPLADEDECGFSRGSTRSGSASIVATICASVAIATQTFYHQR